MNEQNTKTVLADTPPWRISQPVALQEGQTQGNAGETMGSHLAASERGGNCVEASVNIPEPMPTPNSYPAVWDLVVNDMQERDRIGDQKYGTRLKTFNGRDALIDLTQELMDGIVYLRQFREEMSCLGKNLLEIQNVLAESQFLSREDCASLADSLMQSLRKNPALCVG